jgi:hypothetical protein
MVRKISGYNDEPCKGALSGLRSIRLSKSYRAYYRIIKDQVEFVVAGGSIPPTSTSLTV